jgi:hypothetical protein
MKAKASTGASLASRRIYLKFAEQTCWIACNHDGTLRQIESAVSHLARPVASNATSGLDLNFSGPGGLRISVFHRGQQCDLSTIFHGPEWKLFTRVPHEQRLLFSCSLFGDDACVEFAGRDMVVLSEQRWILCILLVYNWLLLRGERLINLHAAVCAIRGSAVVLIGPSGAGKSTLALALRQHGADVYGDEWAYFTLPDFRLYVWERGICLRPGGIDALGVAPEGIKWYEAKPGDPKCAVPRQAAASPCPRDRVHLFFTDGFGEWPDIRPIPGGEATRRLIQGMSFGSTDLMARLAAATDLVNRYAGSLLTIGRPADTASAIVSFLEQASK